MNAVQAGQNCCNKFIHTSGRNPIILAMNSLTHLALCSGIKEIQLCDIHKISVLSSPLPDTNVVPSGEKSHAIT